VGDEKNVSQSVYRLSKRGRGRKGKLTYMVVEARNDCSIAKSNRRSVSYIVASPTVN
jgi:hypothetical protein